MKTTQSIPKLLVAANMLILASSGAVHAGTVGYWRFEDSPGFLNDSSGNVRTLTNNGAATQVTNTFFGSLVPKTGDANAKSSDLELDTTQFFSRTDSAFAFTPSTALTVEAYVQLESSHSTYFRTITGQYPTTTGGRSWRIGVTGDTSPLGGRNFILQLSSDGSSSANFDSDFVLTTGKNYYVAASTVQDGANYSTTFYFKNITDSGPLQTKTVTLPLGGIFNSTADFGIGNTPGGPNAFWDGKIDEVRISDTNLAQSDLLIYYSAPAVTRGATGVADGGSDAVGGLTPGVAVPLTYTISNPGTTTVTLTSAAAASQANCTASVTSQPADLELAPGESTSMEFSVTPTVAGAWSFEASFGNDTLDKNPFNWTVSGTGSIPAPEIDVTRSSSQIADGGSDNAGGSPTAVLTNLTYSISNTGNADLTLADAVVSNPSNCNATVSQQPVGPVTAAANTSLVIAVTPNALGAWSFDISVPNDDSNENPYNWTVSGTVYGTTVGYWRFEDTPGVGFLADSGFHNFGLTKVDTVNQITNADVTPNALLFPNPVPANGLANLESADFGTRAGHFTVADAPAFTVSDFTIEAFVRASSFSSETQYIATQWFSSGTDRSWAFGVGDERWGNGSTQGRLIMLLSEEGGSTTDGTRDSGLTLEAGKDYYVAASFDLSNQASGLTFYLKNLTDGGPLQSVSLSHTLIALKDTTKDFTIGVFDNTAARRWAGHIDEVRLSNQALNPAELLASTASVPAVVRGVNVVADGGSDAVGAVTPGVAVPLTYTISNPGTTTVTLTSASATTLANCTASVTTQPADLELAPGESTSVEFSVTPTAAGAWSFDASFGTDIPEKNPYNWTVSGTAATTNTFATWISDVAFGLAVEDQDFGDDPDGDNLGNGIEAFFGTNPSTFSPGLTEVSKTGNVITFEHPQKDPPLSNVTGTYEWSLNLVDWHASGTVGSTTVTITPTVDGGGTGITSVAVDTTGSTPNPDKLFVRVKASN